MQRSILALVLATTLALPGLTAAGSRGGGHPSSHAAHASSSSSHHASTSSYHRGGHGKNRRDPEQRRAFMHSHPCPSTGKTYGACPGYVVDHVQALKHGGRDDPSNMQWQTKEAAKQKDRWE